MKKGKLIGKGMTAEVFEWERDKVLKLYFNKFGEEWLKYEAGVGKSIHAAGIPSPAVYEIVSIDERKGIVFQRITGSPLIKHIKTEPWNIIYYAKQLAILQHKIHQFSANDLPSQKERFSVRIKGMTKISEDKQQRILEYIDCLPDGKSVCHGDLHFGNIIISGNRDKLTPIDWTNAYSGNPLGDVARTCLMLSSPGKPLGVTDLAVMLSQYIKWLTYWSYLDEYKRISNAGFEDIDAWILPAAAAKLRDNVPGEDKWLVDIINRKLGGLKLRK